MGWPYQFLDLTSDEKAQRRELLDQYAFFAQVSVLVPLLACATARLCVWLVARTGFLDVEYSALSQLPESGGASGQPKLGRNRRRTISQRWRQAQWWLDEELASGWGLRGRWIVAIVWTLWLLGLCALETENGKQLAKGDHKPFRATEDLNESLSTNPATPDYLHITKRFGIIAASQMPLLFLLSMRTRFSPLCILLKSSHDHLMHWHQMCGRIIMIFVSLHGACYVNFYIQKGIFVTRLQHQHPLTGLIALLMIGTIAMTSLEKVRRWSYRLFIYSHISTGVAIWLALLFHAKPLRLYAVESLAVYFADRILRYFDTVTSSAVITQVPRTNLLQVTFTTTLKKRTRFLAKSGQHVYLSFPAKDPCSSWKSLLSNPFTIAEASAEEIKLVLRARQGLVTRMLQGYTDHIKGQPTINIEGPYGGLASVVELVSTADRILLVAGGIGATFILPVSMALREHLLDTKGDPDRLHVVWALKSAAEGSWTLDSEKQILPQRFNISIYVTGRHHTAYDQREMSDNDDQVEMNALQQSPCVMGGIQSQTGRPDLRAIVDGLMSYHPDERVAVVFCGPKEMGRELRSQAGRWVAKGRDVLWHEEGFGW